MQFDLNEILDLYRQGYFLMDNGDGLGWYASRRHALIPLDGRFHTPKSLRRALNSGRFEVRINTAFEDVVRGCAQRIETWITPELHEIYVTLRQAGVAHSFETWVNGELAGGILGLSIGAAFIGESMFFQVEDASKVAMVRLQQHLRAREYLLFDAQIQNPHLARFGAFELGQTQYLRLLERAVVLQRRFD